jgi:hypothetical protein
MGAFTLTARTFPGELAELERILGDMGVDAPEGIAKVRGMTAVEDACMAERCKMLSWLRRLHCLRSALRLSMQSNSGMAQCVLAVRMEPGRDNQLAA